MRIFENCHEMHSEVKRDLHEMGTIVHPQTMQDQYVAGDDRFETLELSPCVFTLIRTNDAEEYINNLKLNLDWLKEDFDERISSMVMGETVNPGEAWTHRADTWRPFIHGGKFSYTYSERLGRRVLEQSFQGALSLIVDQLSRNPDTRQAVLPIFDACDDIPNLGGIARVPCSMYYQFLRRRGQLDIIYTMRSCDFMTHFPYDIAQAAFLKEYVSQCLDCPEGRLTFFAGSLHIYQKDMDQGTF